MKKLYGVVTPLSTPMDEQGRIDYDSLENLCQYLIDQGVNGLYPNGTTGEVIYLTAEERKKILERTLKAADGRITVFSMVGAATTCETVALARHAEEAGADGIGVVTPYYFKLTDEELFQHYCCIANSVSSDFPVYLYAIPQMAVNDISVSLAKRIAEACPNVVGIKYSFPDMPKMLSFQNIRKGDFSVLTGPDDLFYALLASGGDGTISGNSNVIPQEYAAVYSAFQQGDYREAARRQARVNQLNAILSGTCNLASYKACLAKKGVIRSKSLRAPLRFLSPDEEKNLFERLEQFGGTSLLAPVQDWGMGRS